MTFPSNVRKAFSLTAFSLLCKESFSKQTCQKFLTGRDLATLESVSALCHGFEALSESEREKPAVMLSKPRDSGVLLPITFWKANHQGYREQLGGLPSSASSGEDPRCLWLVQREHKGQNRGHQPMKSTETHWEKLGTGPTSAEEDGTLTGGDTPTVG